MALNNEPRKMISNDILHPCLALDLQVEFLEVRLRIFLLKEMLECKMVSVHNDLGV